MTSVLLRIVTFFPCLKPLVPRFVSYPEYTPLHVSSVPSPPSTLMPKKPQVYHPGVTNLKSPRARLDSQQGCVHRVFFPADTFLMLSKLWYRYFDHNRRTRRISAHCAQGFALQEVTLFFRSGKRVLEGRPGRASSTFKRRPSCLLTLRPIAV